MTILTYIPCVHNPLEDSFESDEKRYEWQMSVRANYLLLGDKSVNVPVDIIKMPKPVVKTNIKWLNRGELIAGSFMCTAVQGSSIGKPADIDIYFKSKNDAAEFIKLNNLGIVDQNDVYFSAFKVGALMAELNLIFGVHYEDPVDLVSHFDIRACSIALDPSTNIVYAVAGAATDCAIKRVVYNPVPHNTTIARLVKYVKKGFDIDPYQRLFLAELIKSDQYNSDLEITTGYRAITK